MHLLCRDNNLRFLAEIKSETIKLVVASPPYLMGKEYDRKRSLQTELRAQAKVIREAVRVLHPCGSLCWQVGNFVKNDEIVPLDIVLYPMFAKLGLKLKNRIIWHFGQGLHCRKRLSPRYETILWFTKSADYTFNLDAIRVPSKQPDKRHHKGPNAGRISSNPLGKNPSDVWMIPCVAHNHPEKTIHPCQFPVELVERLVLALTNPGDLVLDPYVGVGSSVIGAAKHGRIGFGCDSDERYIYVAQQRLNLLRDGKLRTRPMNQPIYSRKVI